MRDYVWKNGCLFTDVFVLIADCLFIICDHRGKEQVSMITNFGVSWLLNYRNHEIDPFVVLAQSGLIQGKLNLRLLNLHLWGESVYKGGSQTVVTVTRESI